jgi:hypothetical protein
MLLYRIFPDYLDSDAHASPSLPCGLQDLTIPSFTDWRGSRRSKVILSFLVVRVGMGVLSEQMM